jgi:hypothetical protein
LDKMIKDLKYLFNEYFMDFFNRLYIFFNEIQSNVLYEKL